MDKVYSLDEIALIPNSITYVKSRKDVNPYDENGKLPLFVAPMTCILNTDNYDIFNENTYAVLPVFADKSYFLTAKGLSDGWFALPLNMFRELVENAEKREEPEHGHFLLCVDMANGHMKEIFSLAKRYKKVFPEAELMIGNIANVQAYEECCEAGIDYVRVGIGGGTGCITSVQTGFHKGMVSLLEGINEIKQRRSAYYVKPFLTKVIADGGVNTIAKAIKCLALGADYVMAGSLFASCAESAGDKCYITKHTDPFGKVYFETISMNDCDYERMIKNGDIKPWDYAKATKYYGQASREGQMDRFGEVKSEPEGCCVYLPVKYTYKEFISQFTAALSCAMSYANAETLSEFRNRVEYDIQSISEFNSYNK